MRIAIFGKHPVPQPGFEGVMSIYEAKWFSLFGHEVDLLIPVEDRVEYNRFLRACKGRSVDELDRLNGTFNIRLILPKEILSLAAYDVGIWQSYTAKHYTHFWKDFKDSCSLVSKNFPKFIRDSDLRSYPSAYHQFREFDHVAIALKEDYELTVKDTSFYVEYSHRITHVPRGADPYLLNPSSKTKIPSIALDAPIGNDQRSIEHIVKAVGILKSRRIEFEMITLNKEYKGLRARKIPFGDFRHFYQRFLNPAWLYFTINYRYSPSHLKAKIQSDLDTWKYKAIYEVQNIEAQMSGAAIIGHSSNLIGELYDVDQTGFLFPDFSNAEDIANRVSYIFENFEKISKASREFALKNFSWEDSIRKWESGLINLMDEHPKSIRTPKVRVNPKLGVATIEETAKPSPTQISRQHQTSYWKDTFDLLMSNLFRTYSERLTCIDIGAGDGATTASMADVLCAETIYSIEPDPVFFSKLQDRFSKNASVECVRAAISNGESSIRYLKTPNGLLKVLNDDDVVDSEAETFVADRCTGVDFLNENSLESIDLLNLNTGTYDLNALRSFESVLSSGRIAAINIEVAVNPDLAGKVSWQDVISYLGDYGFRVFNFGRQTFENHEKPFLRRCDLTMVHIRNRFLR